MDNMGQWEQNNLISELKQGWELAKQLQIHLNVPSSSHDQTRGMLVAKIISSYEKAISMLSLGSSSAVGELQITGLAIESPPSLSGSPRSEDSDRDAKDQEHKDSSRKRKTFPRWSHRVTINPGTASEGTLDDGFSWRKYGQKDILGAKYPRGYFRCTHRNVQGCLATKQVQRSDHDPQTFEITYRGYHTCAQAAKASIFLPSAQPEHQEANNNSKEPQQQHQYYQPQLTQHQPEALLNLRQSLRVETEDLHQSFPSFNLPSTTNFPSVSNMNAENQVFSPSMAINNTTFSGNFSPSSFVSPGTSGTNYFVSPGASETNYFSASPSGINTNFQGDPKFQNPESSEGIPAATSSTNSPTVGLDYQFGNVEYDQNFIFDSSYLGFFSPFDK